MNVNEQKINDQLAKWLSERTGKEYEIRNGDLVEWVNLTPDKRMMPCDFELGLFTESLDSMKLVTDAMTDEEFASYAAHCTDAYALGHYVFDFDGYAVGMAQVCTLLKLTASQRALAACRALGLEVGEEEGERKES